MEKNQREVIIRAVKIAEDIMTIYNKECGFDEDYECGKMVNVLIDLIDAFFDQIEIIETNNLLKETVDMLYLIVERYELGDVSAETTKAFKKVRKKADSIKSKLNL